MKIVNVRTGNLQQIPFSLGEKGRGRWLEEVKVSNRVGQEPKGPEDVGYFSFGNERKHVILTKGNPRQKGVLLRINTLGTYTKDTVGSVLLKGGEANKLVAGNFAFGDAGRIGSATDELWHVEGPAVFVVHLCGGSSKGYGHRYLIITPSFRTVMIKRDELCQLIVSGSDPEVAAVAKAFGDQLHEEVQEAIRAADTLDKLSE